MNEHQMQTLSPALRVALLSTCAVIVIAGLRLAATLLVPLALALFLAAASLPLLVRLVERGWRVWLAVLLVVVLDLAVLLVVASLVVRSIAEVAAAIPGYAERLLALEANLLRWLANFGVRLDELPYVDSIPSEHLIGFASSLFRGATGATSMAFLVGLITIFLLLEATALPRKLHDALGRRGDELAWFATVLTEVQHYLALKTLISAATGLILGTAAWLLGVDFALLWGLLAFFLNFIPNVGSILAAFPAVIVALLQHGVPIALVLALVYLAVNMVIGNLIEPALMGRRLGLSPLVVVLSLVFWGWVWGGVGMFLSVPLAMVTKIVLEHTRDYRWIAVLMAGNPGRGRRDEID